MGLFGTSGVRGVINSQLTPEMALRLGQALAVQSGGGKVALARDSRSTGPMIESAITAGLMSGGFDVTKLGLMPTPALAYVTRATRSRAGVMVTASHNPPEYNGIKFFGADGMAFTEEQEQGVESLYHADRIPLPQWDRTGKAVDEDADHIYIDGVLNKLQIKKRWRVILDTGGGASCYIAPRLFKLLGFDLKTINDRPDGKFLARSPEPSEEALSQLSRLVALNNVDLGIAFDGDADRFALVDSSGKYVQMDLALAAYAERITRERKSVIVVPVDTSMAVEEVVKGNGSSVVYSRVGDVSVVELVKAHNAPFGGESSGAWINSEFHLCPDGILSSLLFMVAVEEEGLTVRDFIKRMPTYQVKRTKVHCPDSNKERAMNLLKVRVSELAKHVVDINSLDGLKVSFQEGWFLIRPSGTEPALRVTVESKDEETTTTLLEDLVQKVAQIVRKVGA